MNDILRNVFLRQIFALALFMVNTGANAALQEGIAAFNSENFPIAMKELKPLAEKGDSKAQYLLAIMYENGQGVTENPEQALFWFSKSSEQGDDQAMFHLGGMYRSGHGVPVDLVLAHKWYALAAAAGNEFARHTMEAVETKLTPTQIKKAKTLVKEWMTKHRRK